MAAGWRNWGSTASEKPSSFFSNILLHADTYSPLRQLHKGIVAFQFSYLPIHKAITAGSISLDWSHLRRSLTVWHSWTALPIIPLFFLLSFFSVGAWFSISGDESFHWSILQTGPRPQTDINTLQHRSDAAMPPLSLDSPSGIVR